MEEQQLFKKIQIGSYLITATILAVGIVVGITFFVARLRLDALTAEENKVTRKLSLNTQKEVLLLTLKDRLPMVEKTVAAQYSWKQLLESLGHIVSLSQLKAVSLDSSNVLRISVTAHTFEELEDMTKRILELVAQKKLRKPLIESLAVGTDNVLEVAFQVTPVI